MWHVKHIQLAFQFVWCLWSTRTLMRVTCALALSLGICCRNFDFALIFNSSSWISAASPYFTSWEHHPQQQHRSNSRHFLVRYVTCSPNIPLETEVKAKSCLYRYLQSDTNFSDEVFLATNTFQDCIGSTCTFIKRTWYDRSTLVLQHRLLRYCSGV
jgi:hypothetical protein